MSKTFTLLFSFVLLIVLAQARPQGRTTTNKLDVTIEKLPIQIRKHLEALIEPVLKNAKPILNSVVEAAKNIVPQNESLNQRIARLVTVIQRIEELDDNSSLEEKTKVYVQVKTLLAKYKTLDESKSDDAFIKKTLKQNGVEQLIEEHHYRKVVFWLDLKVIFKTISQHLTKIDQETVNALVADRNRFEEDEILKFEELLEDFINKQIKLTEENTSVNTVSA